MIRGVAETARVLGSTPDEVKALSWKFRTCLSASANPGKGIGRSFEDDDVLALVYIKARWSQHEEDFPDIVNDIQSGEHQAREFKEHLYGYTPLLQEPPEGLDETWTHGTLYVGSFFTSFELARTYRHCADELLEQALRQDLAMDMRSPILFAYRHALELYLKVLGPVEETTHSVRRCLEIRGGKDGSQSKVTSSIMDIRV